MTTGSWLNYDGLYLQYGTTKAVQEMAGDYTYWGPVRCLEAFISLGAASISNPTGSNNLVALPSSFQGTVASQTAAANTGIISYTTLFPLQPTAPVTVGTGTPGVLTITNPQLWISSVEAEMFVAAATAGSATGIAGVGLVAALPANGTNPSSWAQVTPNAGVQLCGALTNAQMPLGRRWTWFADKSEMALYTGTTTAVTTYPAGPSWMGNVPLTTLSETFLPGSLPNNAYLSCITTGSAQYTGAADAGLVCLRVFYRQVYTINDANQI